MLPPAVVVQEGDAGWFRSTSRDGATARVTCAPHRGWTRARAGGPAGCLGGPPQDVDGVPDRPGHASPCRGTAAWAGISLHAESAASAAEAALVVTPGAAHHAPSLEQRRGWGLATQLYSVRSKRSWGIGDFADLADLAALGRERGRRLRPGQSPARGRARAAGAALAVLAVHAAVLQPAVPPGGGIPGTGVSEAAEACRDRPAAGAGRRA